MIMRDGLELLKHHLEIEDIRLKNFHETFKSKDLNSKFTENVEIVKGYIFDFTKSLRDEVLSYCYLCSNPACNFS